MWKNYIQVRTIEEALPILDEERERARIVAGATDLILEIERGVRKGIDTLVDITRVRGIDRITLDEDNWIHLGPLVTHNHCVGSKLVVEQAYPLARAAWEVGAPQIRNRGTVAGNLITASPANDTISPLMALGAVLTLRSVSGLRKVPLKDFYLGVRKTVMQPGEMLVDISFPAMTSQQRGAFVKLGLRRAQAISLVNAAVVVTFDGNPASSPISSLPIRSAAVTLGAVAPTIIFAEKAMEYLADRKLDDATIEEASRLAMEAAAPIGDVRSTANYRQEMVRVAVRRCLKFIATGKEREGYPAHPPLLMGVRNHKTKPLLDTTFLHSTGHTQDSPIITRINGKEYILHGGQNKTLLRLIREDAGLTGTKEGCAEGECGACTVYLDGVAVMACLVPAPRAHRAEIITIEGIASEDHLHPIQQAFIDEGAVQCGYCTPGFVMSAVKLLEEQPHPSEETIKQAITGNLCRCTGYYKIVKAIEQASQWEKSHV